MFLLSDTSVPLNQICHFDKNEAASFSAFILIFSSRGQKYYLEKLNSKTCPQNKETFKPTPCWWGVDYPECRLTELAVPHPQTLKHIWLWGSSSEVLRNMK